MGNVLGYFKRGCVDVRVYSRQVVADCLGGGVAVSYGDGICCLAGGDVCQESGKRKHPKRAGLVCVFSGELLNHDELCQEHKLRLDKKDAEVCLALFRSLGAGFASVLSGPFVMAIYDGSGERLWLYRDHVGQHPLFYSLLSNGHLVFGDDLRCLMRLPGCSTAIDLQGLSDYLSLGYVPAPQTIYRGVRKVRPGCCLSVRRGGGAMVEEVYWQPSWAPKESLGFDDAVSAGKELLARSVSRCRRRHPGSGVLLSGGLDSNLVLALCASDSYGDVSSYTVGFGDASYDERALARESSLSLGVQNYSCEVIPEDWSCVDRLQRLSGEPFGDSSLVPTVKAMELCGAGAQVLTGSGGDEIFGGYRRYQAMCWRSLWRFLPQWLLNGISCLGLGILPGYGETRSRLGTVRRLLKFMGRDSLSGYGSFQEVFSQDLKAALLADSRLKDMSSYLQAWSSQLSLVGSGASWLEQFNRLDMVWYLPDDGCRKEWLASQYAGVGKLSPLLDRELIEFGLRLPGSLRVTRRGRKRVLQGLGHRLLCPSITGQHGKRGFGVPVASWFRGPCGSQLNALCDGVRDWDRHGWFSEEGLRHLAEEHRSGQVDHGARLWVLWCLRSWLLNH